jgi:S1-C subfamily serine protease
LPSAPYLQNAGLKAGDVILAINGRSMSDVQSNQAMIEELMVGGKARVELMRNNTRLTITVSIPNQR